MKSYTLGLQSWQNHHIHHEEEHDCVSASRYNAKLGGCNPAHCVSEVGLPLRRSLGGKDAELGGSIP